MLRFMMRLLKLNKVLVSKNLIFACRPYILVISSQVHPPGLSESSGGMAFVI